MKGYLRTMAVVLLMLVGVTTYTRRNPPGAWIAFEYQTGISVITDDGRFQRNLLPDGECGYSPIWSSDGESVMFLTSACIGSVSSSVMRITLDGKSLQPADGEYIPLTQDTSPDGQRVFADPEGILHLSEDEIIPIDRRVSPQAQPVWSPDGEWIAFMSGEFPDIHIFRVRPDGSDLQQITEHSGIYLGLQWSPDSEWLIFSQAMGSRTDIYRIRADGASQQFLAQGSSPQTAPFVGRAWNPLWLILAAALLMILSLVKGIRR